MSTHAGRVALVTGSGRGIGRAIADRLGEAGAAVAYLDHDPELARMAADDAVKAGRAAIGVSADVADAAAIAKAVKQIEAALGPVDILVNNAGISPKSGPDGKRALTWDMEIEEWQRVVGVNLTGAFICSHAVLPGMVARQRRAKCFPAELLGYTSQIRARQKPKQLPSALAKSRVCLLCMHRHLSVLAKPQHRLARFLARR
jgi:3-oxoacyl-[acyl-carrier protein] reductase